MTPPLSSTCTTPLAVTRTLACGATLVFQPMPGAPRLAMQWFLPGGNVADPVAGMVDLIDRLLLKGTQTRSQEQLSADIDALSLEFDTDARRDYSVFSAVLLPEDLDASLTLMADVLYNATLESFSKEKDKLAGEIKMELDAPKSVASDAFIRALFADSAYATVGSRLLETLPQINTQAALSAQYHQLYQTCGMLISAAGDISIDVLAAALNAVLQPGNGPARQYAFTPVAHHQPLTVTNARDDSSQAHIYKGWLAPAFGHADTPAITVLNTILGGAGLSSRMFTELRDKQGLAYNVRSSYEAYRHHGSFTLYIGTEPSKKQRCLEGFVIECDKLMNVLVPEAELAAAKQNLLGRRSVFLETASQRSAYVGGQLIQGRSLDDVQAIPARLAAVTAADVQRVAQAIFSQPAVTSITAPSSVL